MASFENWHSTFASLDDQFTHHVKALPFRHQYNLRGDVDDDTFNSWVKQIFNCDLAREPNTVNASENTKILWLGPDEWLAVSSREIILKEFPAGCHMACTDVSANRVILELNGPKVRDILSKCCELDFHPRVFKTGQVVQTLIAKSQAIIEQCDKDRFQIYVRNSFSRYVAEWLLDAAEEYEIL